MLLLCAVGRPRIQMHATDLKVRCMFSIMEIEKLPNGWKRLRPHKKQFEYFSSEKRFNIVPAGRRSGKTEIAKRRGVRKAIAYADSSDGWFVFAAPTHNQAKRIYWRDLKRLIPLELRGGAPSESELTIPLYNGATVQVMGLDVPERIEGPPLNHIVLDEFGNMKESVWTEHVRGALSDRKGSADFIGVPEGRNHYYERWKNAQNDERWGAFTWTSEEILDAEEIAEAKNDLDERTYNQEYKAHFITFQGLAYYAFSEEHNVEPQRYDAALPLILCFDFNVSPGTASIVQEFGTHTAVIDEVWIERNSNTPLVCERITNKYAAHEKEVYIYGDATGGAKGSAKVSGSDWDLISNHMKKFYGSRAKLRISKVNPRERVRINAMNSRLCTADESHKLKVDASCTRMIEDLAGVRCTDGGEINKQADPKLSHLSDGLGYYIEKKYPIRKGKTVHVEAY